MRPRRALALTLCLAHGHGSRLAVDWDASLAGPREPEIERVVSTFFDESIEWVRVLIPDEPEKIVSELNRLCDIEKCDLIIAPDV